VRDPTVYKPRSQLATPAGIDHDYNFLHGIEHRIERSEKEIVEERRLVEKAELESARRGEEGRKRKREPEAAGEAQIKRVLEGMGTVVKRAPKGMRRNVENGTSWSRNQKCIYWQVEWIHGEERVLGKAMGKRPLGEAYMASLDEERRKNMSSQERKAERKRKATESKQRLAKKARTDAETDLDLTTVPILQDPETGAWNVSSILAPVPENTDTALEGSPAPEPIPSLSQHLYLYRPHTPSTFPKVLIPLDATQPLDTLLRGRVLLEFPTIYVLDEAPDDLPEKFMLEKQYLAAIGQESASDTEMGERGEGTETSSSEEDETSSSGEDEVEDGEVV
jgi:ribosomal protein L44E